MSGNIHYVMNFTERRFFTDVFLHCKIYSREIQRVLRNLVSLQSDCTIPPPLRRLLYSKTTTTALCYNGCKQWTVTYTTYIIFYTPLLHNTVSNPNTVRHKHIYPPLSSKWISANCSIDVFNYQNIFALIWFPAIHELSMFSKIFNGKQGWNFSQSHGTIFWDTSPAIAKMFDEKHCTLNLFYRVAGVPCSTLRCSV